MIPNGSTNYTIIFIIKEFASKVKPAKIPPNGTDSLTILQFAGADFVYKGAIRNQAMRLISIGLFEQLDFKPNCYPFYSGAMGEKSNPTIVALKSAVANPKADIDTIERERPKISKY